MNSAAWAGDSLLWTIKQKKFLKEKKERNGQREGNDIRIATGRSIYEETRKSKKIYPGGRGVGTPMSLCMF